MNDTHYIQTNAPPVYEGTDSVPLSPIKFGSIITPKTTVSLLKTTIDIRPTKETEIKTVLQPINSLINQTGSNRGMTTSSLQQPKVTTVQENTPLLHHPSDSKSSVPTVYETLGMSTNSVDRTSLQSTKMINFQKGSAFGQQQPESKETSPLSHRHDDYHLVVCCNEQQDDDDDGQQNSNFLQRDCITNKSNKSTNVVVGLRSSRPNIDLDHFIDASSLPLSLLRQEKSSSMQENHNNMICSNDNESTQSMNGNDENSSFLNDFVQTNGPPQITLIITLIALGFGSVIGVVPAIMTDRYARINHGYSESKDCSAYTVAEKPDECMMGSADAQNAVALETFVSSMLTFFTSSWLGSVSDMHGRRGILIAAMIVATARPLVLILIQLCPSMNPNLYYVAGAVNGLFNWMSLALSSLSDVVPKKWRAASFGLLLAGFMLGLSIAPLLAIFLGHFNVSVFSLVIVTIGLFISIFLLPETLSPESAGVAKELRQKMLEEAQIGPFRSMSTPKLIMWYLYRPLWELSILNRNRLFRLLSVLAFVSGVVSSGDQTLLIYYIEERLNFNDTDIGTLFLLVGCLGVLVQGVLLKFVNDWLGERRLLVLSFGFGCIHNFLYGVASNKATIYVAIVFSSLVGMSFPTISAIKANNVESSEQGRIQGALSSVAALASATGPVAMRFVYHYTKDGAFMGPGSMFIFASGVYSIAVYCAFVLPLEANSVHSTDSSDGKSTRTSVININPTSLEQNSNDLDGTNDDAQVPLI